MQCLSPLSIPRPGGSGNADRTTVPCGKCASCLNDKRNQWSFRLEQEFRNSTSAYFITLTYDDDHVPTNALGFQSVCKRDVQLFIKRLRKSNGTSSIRYYITAEYGPKTLRPHYHGIIFGLNCLQSVATGRILDAWSYQDRRTKEMIPIGHVSVGTVSSASIAYCTKYCITKYQTPPDREPVFSLMSTRPGIGAKYLETHRDFHDSPDRFYGVMPGGTKVPLPRYYSDRLYSPETRLHRKSILKPFLDLESFKRKYPSKNPFKFEFQAKKDYSDRLFNRLSKLDKL